VPPPPTVPPPEPPEPGRPAGAVSLPALVHHRHSAPSTLPLEDLHRLFVETRTEYLALERDERVTGLASRSRLGLLLGSRFGFALHARSPAHLAQVPQPLVFSAAQPLRAILATALSRQGDEFHEDVVLVDEGHRLLGLIPVDALARLQTQIVTEQLAELQQQHTALRQGSLELFAANHAVRQARGLSERLFESDALGVALLRPDGTVAMHNQRFRSLLRFSASAPGFSLFPLLAERDRARFADLLRAHEENRPPPASHQLSLVLPDGAVRLFRVSTGWIPERGEVCAFFDDVTEQQRVELHIQRQEKQLMLDTIVGGVAHELNNKLTPILGFADLLAGSPTGDPQTAEYFPLIRRSVLEASNLIRQLLHLSQPPATHPQCVDLAELVAETLLMLKFQLRESGITATTRAGPEPVSVRADPGQIRQVIMNLAINAVHALEGRPSPRLEFEIAVHAGCGCVTVRDNGHGIAPEIVRRIFDPFFTTKPSHRGTGLGLSICSSIMRQHGGALTVESEAGQGAAFTITFPCACPQPEAAGCHPAAESGPPLGHLVGRRRVLVVDDEEVVRHFLQEALRTSFGCTVDAADDGHRGLEMTRTVSYDLVVSDVRMPGMNGPQLYRQLRALRPGQAERFVFVTGHVGEASLDAEIRSWGVPLLPKPFSVSQLARVCGPFLGAEPSVAAGG